MDTQLIRVNSFSCIHSLQSHFYLILFSFFFLFFYNIICHLANQFFSIFLKIFFLICFFFHPKSIKKMEWNFTIPLIHIENSKNWEKRCMRGKILQYIFILVLFIITYPSILKYKVWFKTKYKICWKFSNCLTQLLGFNAITFFISGRALVNVN